MTEPMQDPDSQDPHLTDEEILIGSILQEPKLFPHVSHVRPMDFDNAANQSAWAAIAATIRVQGLLTPASLIAIDPQLNFAYLTKLARTAPQNLEACSAAARRISDLRRADKVVAILKKAANDIKQAVQPGNEGGQSWQGILSMATSAAIEYTASGNVRNAQYVIDEIVQMMHTPTPPIATGLSAIDQYLRGGLRGGQVIGFASQTHIGRSVLAATISYNLERQAVPHLFVSIQQGRKRLEGLKIARELGITGYEFEANPDNIYKDFQYQLAPILKTCEYLFKAAIPIEDLRNEILYQAYIGAKIAIIDHMQLVGGRQPRETPEAHMIRVAQTIQQTAIEANIPVIWMVQLTDLGFIAVTPGIKAALNALFTLHRDRGKSQTYLETIVTNLGPEHDIGSLTTPSLWLDTKAGPHFCDPPVVQKGGSKTKPAYVPQEMNSI